MRVAASSSQTDTDTSTNTDTDTDTKTHFCGWPGADAVAPAPLSASAASWPGESTSPRQSANNRAERVRNLVREQARGVTHEHVAIDFPDCFD